MTPSQAEWTRYRVLRVSYREMSLYSTTHRSAIHPTNLFRCYDISMPPNLTKTRDITADSFLFFGLLRFTDSPAPSPQIKTKGATNLSVRRFPRHGALTFSWTPIIIYPNQFNIFIYPSIVYAHATASASPHARYHRLGFSVMTGVQWHVITTHRPFWHVKIVLMAFRD